MQSDLNPYQSPTTIGAEAAPTDLRRPPFGTFLLVLWLLEGGFKAYVVGAGLLSGFNPLPVVAGEYQIWNPVVFFLLSSFFILETIGPWIGIYYLTGRRSRTIPFGKAMWRTLMVAGGIAIGATLVLILYCEIAGSWS